MNSVFEKIREDLKPLPEEVEKNRKNLKEAVAKLKNELKSARCRLSFARKVYYPRIESGDKEAAVEICRKETVVNKIEARLKEAEKELRGLPPEVSPDEEQPWFEKLYYEKKGAYWLSNGIGGWVEVNEKGAERALRIDFQMDTDQIARALLAIQKRFKVAYAGKVAGYKAGVIYQNGDRILVTSGPRLIEPKEGDFSTIDALLNRMTRGDRILFDVWLKLGSSPLMDGSLNTGQVLVLAGPKDCGKSFVQNHIITPLLGGRSFNPTLYMSGGTPFNKPLLENEHLMVEDDAPRDYQSRKTFGVRLKQIAANETDMLHGKGKDGITIKPFRRLSISVNDEASNLDILPVLEESLLDKILILKIHPGEMPMPTRTSEEKKAFAEKIKSELPAYLIYLLKLQIPEEIKGGRYGVKAFQNTEIVEAMQETASEHQLEELIDKVFEGRLEPWDDSALQMYVELLDSPVAAAARTLLPTVRHCGMFLSKLATKNPRYSKRKVNGIQKYRIEFHVEGKPVNERPKTIIDFKTGQPVTGIPVKVEGRPVTVEDYEEKPHVTVFDSKTGEHFTGIPIHAVSFKKDSVSG